MNVPIGIIGACGKLDHALGLWADCMVTKQERNQIGDVARAFAAVMKEMARDAALREDLVDEAELTGASLKGTADKMGELLNEENDV